MRLNTFMTVAAIIAFIFGLGFILAPAQSISLYGTTLNVSGEFLGRYLGASLVGLAFVMWLTRNSPPSETRQGLLTGLFVTMLLGFIVAIYDTFSGAGNGLVWLNAAIYLVLAVGFAYFSFLKSA